jgi:hypothetical protein
MRTSSDLPRALALALVLLAGCKSRPPEPGRALSTGVEVQALIYSGVPNPSVLLTPSQTEELRTLALTLPENPEWEGGTVTPSILGYAGLLVINGTKAGGLPNYAALYEGNVELLFEDRTLYLRDEGGVLEKWLLERLREGGALSPEEQKLVTGR